MVVKTRLCLGLCAALLLSACGTGNLFDMSAISKSSSSSSLSSALPSFSPVSFDVVAGWQNDNALEALKAFDLSCAKILALDPSKDFSSSLPLKTNADWQRACRARPPIATATPDAARAYFEQYFVPFSVTVDGREDGLFTGYFEASLNGSLTKSDRYTVPLRARPQDLVMVNLGDFRDELKGQRIAGRVVEGQLKPYEDRTAIETGKLPSAQDKALLWVDSAVDAFFLQVQGSGVVALPDGSTRRVGYDGQNGHVYSAIGGELIRRGHLTKDNVSMQSIKSWIAAHPDEAIEIMRTNKSYVFFKFIDGDHKVTGPIGGEGVPLHAERSLAIDHGIYPYGLPFFLDAEHPTMAGSRLQQLMIAQDTGGAIKGAIRGDVFWGYGSAAELNAGPMKSKGRFWLLLPK